jgi:hypothetical protein
MIKKISLIFFFFTLLPFSFVTLSASKQAYLYQAIVNNDLDEVKQLLKDGAPIDGQNRYGNTPLHFAARYGRTKIVRYLIEQGANIYILNKDGNMPVYVTKKLEIVNLLLEKEWFDDIRSYCNSEKTVTQLPLLKKISFSCSLAIALCLLRPRAPTENEEPYNFE